MKAFTLIELLVVVAITVTLTIGNKIINSKVDNVKDL